MTAPWFAPSLACPDCGAPLAYDCLRCDCGFVAAPGTPLDLRPRSRRRRTLALPIHTTTPADLERYTVERPPITYRGPRAKRDSAELFSAVSSILQPGARLLDLGCGGRDQEPVATHCGLRYAGIDYSSSASDLLADAHALPFVDGSFDLVLSYAVFEHLHNPFIAAAEVARVLAPGGTFFGTVSQGEPFHHSYFHHTTWGTLALLTASGLTVRRVWSSYDTLHALATMGRYPRLTRAAIELVYRMAKATPWLAPRAYFRSGPRQKQLEELYRAASICFVAERPTDATGVDSGARTAS
jgi:SAM-dependent methyltransferase